MPSIDHPHMYKRVKYGDNGRTIYRCMLPACTHFLPDRSLLLGRRAQCWDCGKEFIVRQPIHKKWPAHIKCGCSLTVVREADKLLASLPDFSRIK